MKKIPVWKNVILLVSLLVVIIIATFAWFYDRPWTSVEDLIVPVGKASYVQISGDQGNSWSDEVDIELGVNKNFKEISGNGSMFFAPVYDTVQNSDDSVSTQILSFYQVGKGVRYYEETFEFRSDVSQDIYLSPESYVTAVDQSGNSYIDGAVRVAFFEVDADGKETLKLIWAPNSTVQYSAATNSFTRTGSVEPYYYYQKSTVIVDPATLTPGVYNDHVAMISTAGTDQNGCGYNAAHRFMWTNGENMPSNAPSILKLDVAGEDNLYYKKMKVKVWIEGHDRECVSLLSGQRFAMKLHFDAQKGE